MFVIKFKQEMSQTHTKDIYYSRSKKIEPMKNSTPKAKTTCLTAQQTKDVKKVIQMIIILYVKKMEYLQHSHSSLSHLFT